MARNQYPLFIRISRRITCVLLVGCYVALASATTTGHSGIWFDAAPITYTSSPHWENVAASILTAVATDSTEPPVLVPEYPVEPRFVFVSISDGESQARVIMGAGLGVQGAVNNAWPRIRAMLDSGTPPHWVRVDFVTSVGETSPLELGVPMTRDRTMTGLAFGPQNRIALLPEQILANRIVTMDGRFLPIMLARFLKSLPGEVNPDLDSALPAQFTTFSTRGFFRENGELLPLYRGQRVITEIRPESLREATRFGAAYLQRNVQPDGRFNYHYLADLDVHSIEYNIVRHAGTIYAMAEAYEVFRDEELLQAISKSLFYLLTLVQDCPGASANTACVVHNGTVKLGANALAVLALSKYMSVTGDVEYLNTARRLARWMVEIQDTTGEFTIHRVDTRTGEARPLGEEEKDYYTGEASFALARLYQLDPDPTWLDAAESAARWIITVRDGDLIDARLPTDHWLMYAITSIYPERSDPLFMEHALRIADKLSRSQRLSNKPPDWFGSFRTPPRLSPTATRMEGLCALYWLVRDDERKDVATRLLSSLRFGSAFLLRHPYHPELAMYFSDPQVVLQGFRAEYRDPSIRIDLVQHALSALLCTARVLER